MAACAPEARPVLFPTVPAPTPVGAVPLAAGGKREGEEIGKRLDSHFTFVIPTYRQCIRIRGTISGGVTATAVFRLQLVPRIVQVL